MLRSFRPERDITVRLLRGISNINPAYDSPEGQYGKVKILRQLACFRELATKYDFA